MGLERTNKRLIKYKSFAIHISLVILLVLINKSYGQAVTFNNLSRQDFEMLGVIVPAEDAIIQDSYKGIDFISFAGKEYSEEQLALLKYFIDRMPAALMEYAPLAIVNKEVGFIPSLAQASGPFIYFNSTSFHTGGFWSANSIEGVFRGFVHEWTHVMQFAKGIELIDFKLARERFERSSRQTHWEFAVMKTELIDSFAAISGWELTTYTHSAPTARLKDYESEKTSNYGRNSIKEDMAETVSYVVIGDLRPLSQGRVNWALNLLGFSLEEATEYTFPMNKSFEIVSMNSRISRFDENKVEAFKEKYPFYDLGHIVSDADFSSTIDFLREGFAKRRWVELSFEEITLENNIKKAIMEFKGKWRDIYLEIISYREATGYLSKPDELIITVLSGYHP